MGRALDVVLRSFPQDRRERIDARFQELEGEVRDLAEVGRVAGKAQADVAAAGLAPAGRASSRDRGGC